MEQGRLCIYYCIFEFLSNVHGIGKIQTLLAKFINQISYHILGSMYTE